MTTLAPAPLPILLRIPTRVVALLLPVAVTVATLTGCGSTPRATDARHAPAGPPPLAAETFEAVWQTIENEHFDRTHNGVDWTAVGDEFRPKVAAVRSDAELRALLEAMIARLGQSHFGIIPREVVAGDAAAQQEDQQEDQHDHDHHHGATKSGDAPAVHSTPDDEPARGGSGDLGILFRLVDDAVMTVAPQPGGAAAKAGLGAGWRVTAIDGRPLELTLPPRSEREAPGASMLRFTVERIAASQVGADPGESVTITAISPAGDTRDFTLTAASFGGEIVRFGNLPPLESHVTARAITSEEFGAAGVHESPMPTNVGLIGFNIWLLPAAAELDAAIDRFRSADGIILDLRGNPGGLGAMAMGIGGHFLNEPKSLGRMNNRDGFIDFRVNPRRATTDGRIVKPFAGPLAILVDPLSASTSEIFAAGLQDLGRAVVIGQTSAGAALPSVAVRLPNGDVLQYAMADFVTPKGNPVEGRGVVPDLAVPLSAELLAREPDPTLAAALRWIAERHRAAGVGSGPSSGLGSASGG